MLSAYAMAGVLGLLVGLRYKVSALITLSLVLVAIATASLPFAGWSVQDAFGAAFAASAALQVGYLSGLAIVCAVDRGVKYWPRAMRALRAQLWDVAGKPARGHTLVPAGSK